MLKANKVQDDSKQLNVVQFYEKRKELEVYQQNTQNIKNYSKTLAVNCFVSLSRENSLKIVKDDREKPKKAVLHKGTLSKFI